MVPVAASAWAAREYATESSTAQPLPPSGGQLGQPKPVVPTDFQMRIFTCTPVDFEGSAGFFERDSGLLCRGLRILGIESRAVMPGPVRADDEMDLIRTEYANLECASWWRSHGLDGLVLYAWGAPRYRNIARAVHDAGVFLVLNQDNGGLVSPLAGPVAWLAEQRNLGGRDLGLDGWLRFMGLVIRGMTVGLAAIDPLRAQHLKFGDVIACVSPRAAEYYRRLCRIYGGEQLAGRVTVLPHGVATGFRWSGGLKKRQIVCVGRWEDKVQKRPGLLSAVIGRLLELDEGFTVAITGKTDQSLNAWHAKLDSCLRDRVKVLGRVGRNELRGLMDVSQIFYSPSAFESFGIAAAEALCCGCSVVAARSVSMASFEWFTGESSGRLAPDDSVDAHVASLRAELDDWADDSRDAAGISAVWCEHLHADKLAGRVAGMVRSGGL